MQGSIDRLKQKLVEAKFNLECFESGATSSHYTDETEYLKEVARLVNYIDVVKIHLDKMQDKFPEYFV